MNFTEKMSSSRNQTQKRVSVDDWIIQCPQTDKILSILLDVQIEVTLGNRNSEWGRGQYEGASGMLQVTLCFVIWVCYISVFNLRKLIKLYIYNLCTFLFVYYTPIKYLKHKN